MPETPGNSQVPDGARFSRAPHDKVAAPEITGNSPGRFGRQVPARTRHRLVRMAAVVLERERDAATTRTLFKGQSPRRARDPTCAAGTPGVSPDARRCCSLWHSRRPLMSRRCLPRHAPRRPQPAAPAHDAARSSSRRARMTTGRSIMLPSKATAPAPSAAAASNAAISRRARSSSASEAPYSSLMIGTCAGWMQAAVVKPSARPRLQPGAIGVEVVDLGELAHRAHRQDAGRARSRQALHGEDVHAVGRGDGAELGGHVLAADRHAGHARLGGDGEEMRQRRGRFDQGEEARVADRHAERLLARRHQLAEQADMLGPHDLGQHQGGDTGHDGGGDVGDGKIERPVDAHHDVGAALGDARHGGRPARRAPAPCARAGWSPRDRG